jgi:hypothetical protein
MQVIGYGMYEPNPELNSRKLAFASIADSSNRILATYYLPSPVYDYRIESLNDETGWKSKMPGRPEITSGNGYLFVNSIAAEQLNWYELESNESNCTLVGKGGKFYPKHSGIYFVVKALPLGNLVSDFVNYHMTK